MSASQVAGGLNLLHRKELSTQYDDKFDELQQGAVKNSRAHNYTISFCGGKRSTYFVATLMRYMSVPKRLETSAQVS